MADHQKRTKKYGGEEIFFERQLSCHRRVSAGDHGCWFDCYLSWGSWIMNHFNVVVWWYAR